MDRLSAHSALHFWELAGVSKQTDGGQELKCPSKEIGGRFRAFGWPCSPDKSMAGAHAGNNCGLVFGL